MGDAGKGEGAGEQKTRDSDKQEPCEEIWTVSRKPWGFKPEVILSPWGIFEKGFEGWVGVPRKKHEGWPPRKRRQKAQI